MSNDCGCNGNQAANGSADAPTLEPANMQSTIEGNTMNDQAPTLTPPQAAGSNTGGSGSKHSDAAPSMTPETLAAAAAAGGGITAWNNDRRVTALWSMNQNRNSWLYINGVGWKKLANNSDSAIVALTILGAHAKQAQTACNYRDEADGMIHETYVW